MSYNPIIRDANGDITMYKSPYRSSEPPQCSTNLPIAQPHNYMYVFSYYIISLDDNGKRKNIIVASSLLARSEQEARERAILEHDDFNHDHFDLVVRREE